MAAIEVLCQLYPTGTTDMHEAGRSASRGDTQARTLVLGPDGRTPILKKVDPQRPGQRALLAVVDTTTASRYGLPTAALRNTAGQFVAATTASLLAGEAAMKPSAIPGVLAPDPAATDPAAYPLTGLSYALSTPTKLDTAAGKDYATFLRYAAGPGQQPGLPPGELPGSAYWAPAVVAGVTEATVLAAWPGVRFAGRVAGVAGQVRPTLAVAGSQIRAFLPWRAGWWCRRPSGVLVSFWAVSFC